jgi:magnesium transporter
MTLFMDDKEILLNTIKYLKEYKRSDFKALLEELQPYDIAKLYVDLSEKHRQSFLIYLEPEQIAGMLQELDIKYQHDVLQRLGIEKSSTIMDLMDNDDLADLLNELSVENLQEYLNAMEQSEALTVQSLMQYPPDTAGGLMTNRFVWIRSYFTVREAVDKFKAYSKFATTIYYLYVLDANKELVGVVSFRDLLLADADELIEDIMFTRLISVSVDTDQEEVAKIIRKYDFTAVPVVDENKTMVGIITIDDVIDIVVEEADEDIARLSAGGRDIDFDTPSHVAAFRRLPWLIFLLLIGLVSANIINFFEHTLEAVVALSFFMVIITGMTGNTGTQSLAVVVRGLASRDILPGTIRKLILRELGVGLIIGLVNGALIALITLLWQGNIYLGIVVGGALFLSLIIGTLAGTIIPLILYYLKIDPAIASGPLITTLNDIFSLTVYFGFASIFLSFLL